MQASLRRALLVTFAVASLGVPVHAGDGDEAIEELMDRLESTPALGDEARAEALETLGRKLGRRGDFEEAIVRLQEAVELRRLLGAPEREAATRQHLCLALQRAGRFDTAVPCFGAVLAFARRRGETRLEARMLNNLGGVDWNRGNPDAALERYRRALELARSAGDPFAEATTRVNRGALLRGLGEIEEALLDYERASRLFDETGNTYWRARVLNNIGAAYLDLGDFDRARAHLLSSLDLRREVGDRAGEAVTLRNLGTTYFRLGANGRARSAYEKALAASLEREDRRGEASSRKLLARIELEDGDTAAAKAHLRRALDLVRDISRRREEAEILERLALAGVLEGATEESQRLARRALEIFRDVRDPVGEVEALVILARGDRRRKRHASAHRHLRQALDRLDAVGGRLGDPGRVAAFVASRRTVHELTIDTLWALHRESQDLSFALEALAVSERARARALLTALASEAEARSVGPGLLENLRRAERSFTGKTRRLQGLVGRADAATLRDAERRRFEALDDLENARAAIRRHLPHRSDAELLSAPDAIRGLLDEDTALVEIFLGRDRSFLWWMTRDTLTFHELPPRREIEDLADRIYGLVSSPSHRPAETRRAMRSLAQILFGPVAERLRGRRLLIVADGALDRVPFAALPSPRSGRPLLADHELVSLPSASALVRHHRRRAASPASAATKMLAILADPVVDGDDPRLAGRRSPPHPDGKSHLGRLSHSRAEAEAIAELFAPAQRSLALGADARRDLVLGGELGDARILHFATHGLVDPRAPDLSGLILSRFDLDGQPIDGMLDLHDLAQLDLSAELVVLSACRTALGESVAGEGQVGPTRALLYAGVPRVVSSLWPVRDRATAELMTRFYLALLEGQTPAAALRGAQLALRTERRYRAPYFWAAFMLQGDPSGFPISSSAPQVPSS